MWEGSSIEKQSVWWCLHRFRVRWKFRIALRGVAAAVSLFVNRETVMLSRIMRCFFFYVVWWNKYALLSQNGLCIEYALFWSCLDSNLTQISQIWHQGCQLCLLCGNAGLPCGRVVVEHEMCGYCGPISLKILLSRPPETEGAIRK